MLQQQVREVPVLSPSQECGLLSELWLKPVVGQAMGAVMWRRFRGALGRAPSVLWGVPAAGMWFKALVVSQVVSACPVRCMLALPVTPYLSLFAFLCVKKCHVKASGAGNVPGRSPCWPGNRDEEHRVVLDEHSPCPQNPPVVPHATPTILSSSLPSPSQPPKIGLGD